MAGVIKHPLLTELFDTLAKAGGFDMSDAEKTIFCDAQETLLLRRRGSGGKLYPHANLGLYRLLLKFNEAGANVVILSDQALDRTHSGVKSFVSQLHRHGLDTRLVVAEDGHIKIGAWDKDPKIVRGLTIDNNEGAHHQNAHMYWHPADQELHDLQNKVACGHRDIVVPNFMKLDAGKLGLFFG